MCDISQIYTISRSMYHKSQNQTSHLTEMRSFVSHWGIKLICSFVKHGRLSIYMQFLWYFDMLRMCFLRNFLNLQFCDWFDNLCIIVRLLTAYQFGYSALHVAFEQEEIEKLQKKLNELQGEVHDHEEYSLLHDHEEYSLLPTQTATSPKKCLAEPRYPELQIPEHIVQFSISQIRKATSNFHAENIIGEGGYGPVYKGDLDGMPVAIKSLRPHGTQGFSEYHQEVVYSTYNSSIYYYLN